MTAPGALSVSCAFRLAACSGWPRLRWSLCMLGATYGHIRDTLLAGNYAPYNFLTIFSDGFIAVWLLVLLYRYHRRGGFQQ